MSAVPLALPVRHLKQQTTYEKNNYQHLQNNSFIAKKDVSVIELLI
jgi:hypothetical protein